ncbi:hypothetical protein, partial [Escherichia coli]|uniref:hypothetical protein n=1 Tax=Escherichia coli TaxID=562 RepID=UPI001BC84AF8
IINTVDIYSSYPVHQKQKLTDAGLKLMATAKMPDALRLSGLVLSLQCRENRPVFSACSPHAVSGLGF